MEGVGGGADGGVTVTGTGRKQFLFFQKYGMKRLERFGVRRLRSVLWPTGDCRVAAALFIFEKLQTQPKHIIVRP
jgi:hypothetical protein